MFEIHITCDRIDVDRISSGAKVMAHEGYSTGDLLLHLKSPDRDKKDNTKSFFSARSLTYEDAVKCCIIGVKTLKALSYTKVLRYKIERILFDSKASDTFQLGV